MCLCVRAWYEIVSKYQFVLVLKLLWDFLLGVWLKLLSSYCLDKWCLFELYPPAFSSIERKSHLNFRWLFAYETTEWITKLYLLHCICCALYLLGMYAGHSLCKTTSTSSIYLSSPEMIWCSSNPQKQRRAKKSNNNRTMAGYIRRRNDPHAHKTKHALTISPTNPFHYLDKFLLKIIYLFIFYSLSPPIVRLERFCLLDVMRYSKYVHIQSCLASVVSMMWLGVYCLALLDFPNRISSDVHSCKCGCQPKQCEMYKF